eukprot:6213327-Pleurochrysis_carterae.AAC.2
MAEPARADVRVPSFTHPPSRERIPPSGRSSGGAGGRAARRPAPRLCGVASGPPTRPERGSRAHILPLAAKQRVSKRSGAPRWSGGRSPRAPKPRRPSPISTERGARQPTQAWAAPWERV